MRLVVNRTTDYTRATAIRSRDLGIKRALPLNQTARLRDGAPVHLLEQPVQVPPRYSAAIITAAVPYLSRAWRRRR